VDRDGVRAAGRWYWREATRAAPYAMLAWLRGLGIGEAAQLVAITAAAVIVARLFQYSPMWLVVASWGTMADSQGLLLVAWRDVEEFRPVTAAVVDAAGWLVPIAGGYVAARLQRRAPLAGAVGLGLLQAFLVLGFGLALIWTASG